jgi:ABC-type multidrug transport system ATPase subunit
MYAFTNEATAALDPQSRRLLWDIELKLREQGKTILLTTHNMDEVQMLCDRIAIMDSGRIIAFDLASEPEADSNGNETSNTKREADLCIVGG